MKLLKCIQWTPLLFIFGLILEPEPLAGVYGGEDYESPLQMDTESIDEVNERGIFKLPVIVRGHKDSELILDATAFISDGVFQLPTFYDIIPDDRIAEMQISKEVLDAVGDTVGHVPFYGKLRSQEGTIDVAPS